YEGAEDLWKALDKVRLQFGMEAHGLHPGRAKKVAILVTLVALAAIGTAIYFITKPPEKEIRYEPGTVQIRPGTDPQELARAHAKAEFGEIDKDDAVGRLSEGTNWKNASLWNDVTDRYDKLAANAEYAGTEFVEKATK